MNLFIQKKILPAVSLFAFLLVFCTCRKNEKNVPEIELPDISTKVTASVSGFVTNEDDVEITGAKVQYGTISTITDKYGFFEIKNAIVTENAAVVTVNVDGYFKGIKTFIADAGKSNFCRIKLIPKINSGSVNTTSGGNVALANGLKIAFPANAIMNAATKTVYTGTVNVSTFWIDPTNIDLDKLMPGDLRGLDENGELKGLVTYGMAVVELTGTSGELLQIASGKKATLTIPIPSTIVTSAPATIPLWYFDEERGLWKEEGIATKTGNTYVGEVTHFSYWNCDLPNATVPVSFTITDSANNPIGCTHVEITPLTSNSWSHCGGYADETGFVHVPVTADATYKLQVFSNSCRGPIPFSRIFSVEKKAVDLGKISIGGGFSATITGTATDCNNVPLANSRIVFLTGNFYNSVYTSTDGSFNCATLLCSSINSSIFIAENAATSQQSNTISYTLKAGSNNIGNIQACGATMEEYSNLTINNEHYILGPYVNSTFSSEGYLTGGTSPQTGFSITLQKLINGIYVKNGDHIQWGMSHDQNPPVLKTGKNNIVYFNLYRGADDNYTHVLAMYPKKQIPFPVNLTEYGLPGQYISGSLNGLLYKELTDYSNLDTLNPYHVTYNFRVKRY